MNDAFLFLKINQIIALEDVHEIVGWSKFFEALENMKLFGSGWVNDRFAKMCIDFLRKSTQCRSSYVELPRKTLSVWNVQKGKEKNCGF